ncbi:hypothetical protein IPV09_11095 [Tessaracoccus sp. SD287]|uniref:hypothetical protein n=1 Tax=Tessaracoccus sp. SD287 TaxID=2782008 RepID=UPI001A966C86|nr:hypothetical protein [Tessaracoccus sp. SD287]MBO1031880.1 hypothetical protein [Tessaracoccus sp. SD287]
MPLTRVFTLPSPSLTIRPVCRTKGPIAAKEYLALFSFESETGEDRVPAGLSWSAALRTPFQYLPDSAGNETIHMAQFQMPPGQRSFTVTIRSWASGAPDPELIIDDVIVESALSNRPVIVLPERL